MMNTEAPVTVAFPLRGEWLSPYTPGSKIPSHGTDHYGTRYAFDFIQVDWNRKGRPSYRRSVPSALLFGVPIHEYYCWGQPVFSPCDGVVIKAEDGCRERIRTHMVPDAMRAFRNARHFNPEKESIQTIAGNYVIIARSKDIYAVLVHLQTGSIQVRAGQEVKTGEVLGRVGHSGNSYAPHLHFQLMNQSDPVKAQGLPCAFARYEVLRNGKWETITGGVPKNRERIRFVDPVDLSEGLRFAHKKGGIL